VAINKVDKPDADVNHVKQQLATEHGLVPEEWGGDTVMIEVSAKTGQNLDKLLELVLLVSDLEELKAESDVPAEGLVIEAHMEQGRGAVVSLLVENGVLKPTNYIVAGSSYGKIRTLLDFAGRPTKGAGPSTPAIVTGFKELPEFGDTFIVCANEKAARHLSEQHHQEHRKEVARSSMSSTDLLNMITRKNEKQLVNVIIKADVQGSLTSVADSLRLLENQEISLRIVGSGVGNISENDIRLAAGSEAIIYGFNVQLPTAVKRLAMQDKVSIRIFKIIYELIDDARAVMTDLLSPEVVETEIGRLIVRGVFRTTRDEIICGGEVTKGKVQAGLLARATRGNETLGEIEVKTVQREKQEAKEVFEGEMCGLQLRTKGKILLEEGDRLDFFTRELRKRSL
jgi:translation initiation factor IF-2